MNQGVLVFTKDHNLYNQLGHQIGPEIPLIPVKTMQNLQAKIDEQPVRAVLVHMGKDSTPQLFDLSNDAGEQKDLAAEKPEIVKKLQAKFDEWNGQLEKPRWNDSRKADGAPAKKAGKKAKKAAAAGAGDNE